MLGGTTRHVRVRIDAAGLHATYQNHEYRRDELS